MRVWIQAFAITFSSIFHFYLSVCLTLSFFGLRTDLRFGAGIWKSIGNFRRTNRKWIDSKTQNYMALVVNRSENFKIIRLVCMHFMLQLDRRRRGSCEYKPVFSSLFRCFPVGDSEKSMIRWRIQSLVCLIFSSRAKLELNWDLCHDLSILVGYSRCSGKFSEHNGFQSRSCRRCK